MCVAEMQIGSKRSASFAGKQTIDFRSPPDFNWYLSDKENEQTTHR